MGAPSRAVVALVLGVLAAGPFCATIACNSLSGVDDLTVGGEGDSSASNSDATTGDGASGTDGSQAKDAHSHVDASAHRDAGGSDGGGTDGDAPTPEDAPSEARADGSQTPGDGGDAATDSPTDGTASDAPTDSPATGPCDGGGPLVVHSNGFAQTFSDCVPLSTYNVTQANEACTAYTGDAGACSVNPGGLTCGGGNLVCNVNGSTCTCWRFDGHPGAAVMLTGGCSCLPNSAPVIRN